MGSGKELGVLEHRRVGDQVVVLRNEVTNVVAVTQWIETGRHSMHQDWECLVGDRELVGQLGHPAVGCAGKEVAFGFTVRHHPYVTTAVTAHRMYARHSVFRACISLVVRGARPRLEVAMRVHQCLIDLF